MSAVEYLLTEYGEPLMEEDNTGGGSVLIVEPFNFSVVNNYMFVTTSGSNGFQSDSVR